MTTWKYSPVLALLILMPATNRSALFHQPNQGALLTCYLQIVTTASPALFCVMTDRHQQKIALCRCSMLRPPPPPLPASDRGAVPVF